MTSSGQVAGAREVDGGGRAALSASSTVRRAIVRVARGLSRCRQRTARLSPRHCPQIDNGDDIVLQTPDKMLRACRPCSRRRGGPRRAARPCPSAAPFSPSGYSGGVIKCFAMTRLPEDVFCRATRADRARRIIAPSPAPGVEAVSWLVRRRVTVRRASLAPIAGVTSVWVNRRL